MTQKAADDFDPDDYDIGVGVSTGTLVFIYVVMFSPGVFFGLVACFEPTIALLLALVMSMFMLLLRVIAWLQQLWLGQPRFYLLPESTRRLIDETLADIDYESLQAEADGRLDDARAIRASTTFQIIKAIAKQTYETILDGFANMFRMS